VVAAETVNNFSKKPCCRREPPRDAGLC